MISLTYEEIRMRQTDADEKIYLRESKTSRWLVDDINLKTYRLSEYTINNSTMNMQSIVKSIISKIIENPKPIRHPITREFECSTYFRIMLNNLTKINLDILIYEL